MRHAGLWLIIAALPGLAQGPDLARILALAKTYFRDSAELPMVVATTTTVTRSNGSIQKEKRGTLRMIFHGYSKTGDFTVSVRGGVFEKSLC